MADMIAPKKRQSLNVKNCPSDLNMETITYIKPLEVYKRIIKKFLIRKQNSQQNYPVNKQDIVVPSKANIKIAPKFLKKCFRFML